MALLAKLIEDGTGMPIDAYAEEKLFRPLDIESFEWIKGADGVPSAASGLRLTLPDLTKIGVMVAQGGVYEGVEVVPGSWIQASLVLRAQIDTYSNYGYLWYLAVPDDPVIAIAVGNGGQRLTVQPQQDFVTASFSGDYNDPGSWRTSLKVVVEFAVPEAKAGLSGSE